MPSVLVVDDSAFMRRYLKQILGDDAGFQVYTARNGAHALEQLAVLRPDVVTLDVNMPQMDGLTCLSRIMTDQPVPVVMLSSITDAGAEATLTALELGAVDYIHKPGGTVSLNLGDVSEEIIAKVRAASTARIRRAQHLRARLDSRARTPKATLARRTATAELVVIGASTGGPAALTTLLSDLPAGFSAPVVVAQHMTASFTRHLSERLDGICQVAVQEVSAPTALNPGHVYVARGDADMVVTRRGGTLQARSVPASPEHRWHPSVDRLLRSACDVVPAERLIAVQLTGMGDDGAEAAAALHAAGGLTIAEAPETAVVNGMPGSLVRLGGATSVLPIDAIGEHLTRWS